MSIEDLKKLRAGVVIEIVAVIGVCVILALGAWVVDRAFPSTAFDVVVCPGGG